MKKCKIIACIALSVTLLCACGKDAAPVETDIASASELPADVQIVGGGADTLEGWAVETVTYTPIMPEKDYTMTIAADDLEEDITDVTSVTQVVSTETVTGTTATSVQIPTDTTVVTTVNIAEEDITSAIATIPDLDTRLSVTTPAHSWYYSKLTAREQQIYDAIINAARNFSATVQFETVLSREEYARLLGLVYLQNPELFWLRGSIDLADDGKSAKLFYLCTQEQAASLDVFLTRQVGVILAQIPPEADDLKKVQIIHDYICRNNVFMKGGTTTSTVIGSLVDGVSQCLGYAKGMQYLCDIVGIPCLTITGTNDSGASHAWNVVQMAGDWYNVDCTWDDPVLKVLDTSNASYMYLGVRDIDIVGITHLDINKAYGEDFTYFEPPVCNSTTLNGDYVYGYYAYSYEEGYEMLREQMLDAVRTGSTVIHVKYAEQDVYLNAVERLKDNKELLNLKNEVNSVVGTERIITKISANRINSLNYFEVYLTY